MGESPSFRASPQQEQMWIEEPLGPHGRVQAVVALAGDVEPQAVRNAVERVVERHEILRTTFLRHAGIKVPLQVVHDSLAPHWQTVKLSTLSQAELASRLCELADEELERTLDYERGPLLQVLAAEIGGTTRGLVLTLPTLCSDASSLGVLLSELGQLLASQSLSGEPLQYADYSEWRHDQLAATDEAAEVGREFWGDAADVPAPRFPLAKDSQADPAPDELPLGGGPDLGPLLGEVCGRYGSTRPVVIEAAWHAFLSRVTGRDDLVVAALNATPRHPDLEGAVGPIACALPIRTLVPEDLTFAELLDQLDRALAEAAVHQDRISAARPAHPLGFAVRPSGVMEDGVRLSPIRLRDSGTVMPLTLAYDESPDGVFGLALQFDREAIDRVHAAMLAEQFERFLGSALADPGAKIGDLDLLAEADRSLLLERVNDTAEALPDRRVHELFEQRAFEAPQAIAVTDGRESLSYAELETRANQLAHRLRQAGVGAGAVVALCTDRSVEMVVGVLGILKAGGAYLPLNQEHPMPRLAFQVEQIGARVLVTQEELLDRVPPFEEVICLDRDRAALEALDSDRPTPAGTLDDLVYVIYTSGSTGMPKGVAVTHRNLANYTADIIRRLGASSERLVFGMATAISTDLGNTAFYPALCSGGTLALIRPEVAADAAAFAERVEEARLDVLKLTPSHLRALLRANDSRVLPRGWLILGGERLSWDLVDRVRSLSRCRILNHYGPTETTVGSCTMLVGDGPGPYAPATVPIGTPIANTRCYILDDRLRPVPLGVEGRLFIGGAGVARGYIGPSDLSAERFIADPFAGKAARMYDTGDLACRLPDGILEFRGRADDQVKVRGFRVEPSEIESVLREHPAVADAAVVAVEEGADDVRLVAYFAPRTATVDDLRRHVAEWLPEIMIPASFVPLDALPVTPSGKLDRMALQERSIAGMEEATSYVAPRTAVEEAVAAVWADVLGLDRVSVTADFFALGGHSLLATQVVAQLRSDFAIEIPLHSLFMYPTVESLSEEVVRLMGAAEEEEGTAELLEELNSLTREQAGQLSGERGGGTERA
jgi:amino acid adenylation domain-containing protein